MGIESSRSVVGRRFPQSGVMTALDRNLHLAVMQNDLDSLLVTIRLGADVDQPWCNPSQPSAKDGCVALSEAVSLNHVAIAKALIAEGAKVDLPDRMGVTPLMKAAYHGRHSIAEMLVKAGADIHQVDNQGNGCLHVCCRHGVIHGHAKCVITLLRCGCNPNRVNKLGNIPLHLSAAQGTPEMVALLMAWGCERDCMDYDYLTPFYHCLKPVLELERRHSTASLLRQTFRRQLPVIQLMLRADCDSLGFASWLDRFIVLAKMSLMECELTDWCDSNRPESLKHLCRVYFQTKLYFTEVRHKYCVRKVKALPIPESLKIYLCRRLLPL